MKKIMCPIVILFLLGSCKTQKNLLQDHLEPIEGKYILFMNEIFKAPLLDTNFQSDKELKDARLDVLRRVDEYLDTKDIGSKKRKNLFADIAVGAVLINLNEREVASLQADTATVVQFLRRDIRIQINPIQQSPEDARNPLRRLYRGPIRQINPIQQSETKKKEYDIEVANNTTKAIITAGGPFVASETNLKRIWVLDTGIDNNDNTLNLDARLSVTFVGQGLGDGNGHGTFCAGVAASKPLEGDPTMQPIHIGVSEGAKVVSVKVLDRDGTGSWGSVISGLDHVAGNYLPGDVVNLSLGAYDITNPDCNLDGVKDAIILLAGKGVFITFSAGNDSADARYNLPGCIDHDYISTASSINADSTCASYANFGAPVDFVTVGTRVLSLWKNGRYKMASGTSVSSAILAGIIHAKGAAPTSIHPVTCKGHPYIIANWH